MEIHLPTIQTIFQKKISDMTKKEIIEKALFADKDIDQITLTLMEIARLESEIARLKEEQNNAIEWYRYLTGEKGI